MKKKILSFMLAFVCIITCGFCLTACANGDMTAEQMNAVFKTAANNFYANHKETATYSAITYHWVETESNKNNEVLEYKANANDVDFVTGTFEQSSVTTTETTVAIKKEGEHLVAEANIVITTTETGTEVDAEFDTLAPYSDVTVETKCYRMFHYVEDAEQKNILVYNYDKTVNGEAVPEEQVKQYAKKHVDFSEEYSMEKYDEFVNETLIQITNEKIANHFFEYAEAMLFYDSMTTLEQNGNQVKLSLGYNLVSVDEENWGVVDINSFMSSYFKDGKIWKAECKTTHTFENGTNERTVAFDYTNEATVNMQVPEDLATYDINGELWANNYNPDGSLRATLYYLPAIAIF